MSTTLHYFLLCFATLSTTVLLLSVRESLRKLEKVREGSRRLEKDREGSRRFEKVRVENPRKWEKTSAP